MAKKDPDLPSVPAVQVLERVGTPEAKELLQALARDTKQNIDIHSGLTGLVSLNALSPHHKTASWAFYLDQAARGGLGAGLEFNFLDHVFDALHLEKLNCEVMESNQPPASFTYSL